MKSIILLALSMISINSYAQINAISFPISDDYKVISASPLDDGGFIIVQYDYTLGGVAKPILIKTNPDLEIIWSKQLDASGYLNHENTDIQQLSDGNYLLYYAGGYMAKFSVSGDVIWHTSMGADPFFGGYSHNSMVFEKPDGKLVFMNTDYEDFKVTQFSSTGVFEWSNKFSSTDPGGYGKCPGFDMVTSADGSVFVSGKRGNDNCFARMDDLGNILWTKVIDFDDSYSRPWGMAEMEDGSVMVVGLRSDKGFIMKMSPVDGSIVWQKEVNDMYFEDVINMGSGQYAVLAKDNYDGNDLGILLFDGEGELINATQVIDVTNWYTYPKFLNVNGKYYFKTIPDYYIGGSYNLVGFDSTLSFECGASPVVVSKIAFTLPMIDLGTLETASLTSGCSFIPLATSVITTNLLVTDLCTVIENAPVSTNENIPLPDLGSSVITSVSDQDLNGSIKVFPNPATQNSSITISLPEKDEYVLKLTDVSGKVVFANTFTGNSTTISSHQLAKGLYILNLVSTSSLENYSSKLIME
jgi:Secretion system C-terminal sorting domain